MRYRIRPAGEWYRIERLERAGIFKKQWNQVTSVSIFDPRMTIPMIPITGKTDKDKEREEKMPTTNAQHALKVLAEIKKADEIVAAQGAK